ATRSKRRLAQVLLAAGSCAGMDDTGTRGRARPLSPRPEARHDLSAVHRGFVGSGRPPVRKAPLERSLSFRRPVRSAGFRRILGEELPIHRMVQEGLNKVRAAVLEIEIVGMFPHVTGEERRLALG